MNLPEPTRRRAEWGLFLIFALLSLGIVAGGAFYYRNYERHFRAEAESQLSAIAELKADELAQYRKERLGDANSFFQNATFSGLVRRFFDRTEDTEAQEQLRGWLNKYQTYYQYDRVFLLDDQGVERMASSAAVSPVSAVLLRQIAEVLRSRKITFHDFHFHEHGQQVYLTLLVPILDGPDYSRPLGVLALRINPETYLYPFIKRWPTPSRTAETLLVRRDGTNVLFLNELKFRTNSALNLRVSLENTNAPAVKAVLGQEGIVEGADYRGEPVLAALHAIPDSPWYLVAKMDTAEVYAPLGERLKLTIVFASLLLISTGLGLGALWRHQRLRFYKERYQIAESLRESEERFRRVFEEGPTGMAMLDETFHFIRVNPAFAAMLGYSEAELQTMTFPDVTHPEHAQQDVEQVRRLLRGELAVYRTEKRYVAKSGKEMWGQVQVVVVRNADGTFHYFLAIITNIAERKQAEQELRRSETKFRTLYDLNSDAVMLLDEKNFFDCNPATLAMFGCATWEEFCSKHPADVSPPTQPDGTDSRTLANQRIAIALEQGINHFEWMHKRVDTGETFPADVLLNAMELDGKPVLLAVVRDITVRKQAEEALLNSRALYLSLVENLPQSIFRKDRAGRFQFVNDRFCRDLRRSPEDIVGRTDADFFPPELAEAYRKDDLRVMDTGQVLDQEEKHVGADGRELFVHVVKTPLRDAQGRVIGIQGVFWDITERKRAEELLRLNQDRLLKIVTQTRCILSSGQVEGPEGWRERALLPESPFRWNFSVQNEEAAQKILPLELAPGERYHQAWFRSRDRADQAQMNWSSGNAFLNDLPFYRNEFRCLDRHGIGHWMQQLVTVRKLAENRWDIFGITTDISDLKRVEAELRESQALYHSLVNQMPAGIFRKDAKGRYVFVNSEFCRLEGLTPDQLLGKTVLELGLKDAALAAKRAADHETIMQSGNPIEADEIHAGADGEKRTYHTIKSPVLDSAGKILGTQGVLFDVTERQRAEQALRDSEERYRQLFELESDAIVLVDRETHRYVDVNRAAQQLYGYSREEFLQMTPEDVSAEPEKTRNHIDSADVHVPLRWHRKKNGERFAVEINANQIIHRGRPTALVALRDITERRRAEEALKESEARYQRISEAITDYIFTVYVADGRAVETTHGPGCLAVTGYEAKEFANDPFLWLRMVAAEDRSRVEDQARRILAGEDPPPIEHRIVRKNGTVRWVRNTFVLHRDERGTLVSYDGLLQDITERKQADEALRDSEARFRRLSEATFEAVAIHKSGVLLNANDQYFKMFGYTPDELLGKQVLPLTVAPETLAYLMKQVENSGLGPYEVIGVRKNGTRFPMEIRVREGEHEGQRIRVGAIRDITERKQAEAALRDSENKFRSLFNNAEVGMFRTRLDGLELLDTNDKYLSMLGRTREEVVGKPSAILWADPKEREEMVKILKAKGHVNDFECRLFNKTGQVINCLTSLRLYPETGILEGSIIDITERKLAEATIARERQLLRTLIDLLPETFYIKGLDGRFLVVNEALAKQWGKENPSQMLGLSDADLFPAEQAAKFRAEELKVFAGEPVINRESICVYYDGRDHTVVTSKVPFRDSQGRICGLVGIGHDISERKRADEALRASEAELRAILESTGDGILAVDRTGEKVIKTNRRFAELWRIPQSIIDAGDNNALRNFVLNQLADPDAFLKRVHELYGTDTEAVDTLVFKDGRILERHGFPMQLDGAVIGRVWSFRDITERKRQERELIEKSSELERFTYTVSHDLKSPLVTVKTFLGYLEQDLAGSDQERVKQDVAYMHTAADKMGKLLDELLNLARVGRKMNPAERVTFKELAQEAVRLVAGRISTGGAEVQVADAAVVLEGDRARLTEIWQNLVENACKFMGNQPKPRVELGVERRGSEMVFFVRDNGAGIEPRYQARVFGLFEKLDPKGEGTGMGLALVKRIVEIYKGRIWVESAGPGQGANFLFTLPAAVILNPEPPS
jgi:PAS domain S-box-containing protein